MARPDASLAKEIALLILCNKHCLVATKPKNINPKGDDVLGNFLSNEQNQVRHKTHNQSKLFRYKLIANSQ